MTAVEYRTLPVRIIPRDIGQVDARTRYYGRDMGVEQLLRDTMYSDGRLDTSNSVNARLFCSRSFLGGIDAQQGVS